VNNQRENYVFRFNGIIAPEAKQDEVRISYRVLTRNKAGCCMFYKRDGKTARIVGM